VAKLDNWQEEMFCREYVRDPSLQAGKAAVRAGYAPDSGSKDSACSRASKLMKRPHVKARIAELMKSRIHRLNLDADDIVQILKRGASADIRDYYRVVYYRGFKRLPEGARKRKNDIEVSELIPPHELTEAQAMAITGVKLDAKGRMTYILAKETMLQLLMRHLGMLNDKVDVTTNGESLNLSDEQRADRIMALVDAARARGASSPSRD
jgi:phage terminase small subunit